MTQSQKSIVNLAAYPIADTKAPARAQTVERFRNELESRQYCVLPGFVLPEMCDQLVKEVRQRLPNAYGNNSRRNCYLQRQGDSTRPDDHPSNKLFDASYRMLAYDLFDEGSLLRSLYTWEPLRAFVADIVGAETLHLSEDPYQPANVLCYGPGDRSAWHFDSTSAFTMTLMLQAAEAGGDFMISPHTRNEAGQDDAGKLQKLRSVLDGDETHVVTVPREPGALVIFRGCTSVHCVSPVEGDTDRLMAVFVYEDEPGVIGDPEVNRTVYGPRTALAQ
ncbi:MAG: hypothetical protein GY948_13360 [Alphaproteobacteria bacterium]|nr:hypothetical protein [Alphaproteobacteria bacterium]